jgi:hypothetical protein
MGVFACIGAGGCTTHGSTVQRRAASSRHVEAVQEMVETHNRDSRELSRATLKPSTLSPPQTRS